MRNNLDFNKFRLLLEEEKIAIDKRLEEEKRSIETFSEPTSDILDDAKITFERENQLGWDSYLRQKQNQIKDAIHRMDTGQFGICINCRKEIQTERLEAKPYASFCIACKEKEEHRKIP